MKLSSSANRYLFGLATARAVTEFGGVENDARISIEPLLGLKVGMRQAGGGTRALSLADGLMKRAGAHAAVLFARSLYRKP